MINAVSGNSSLTSLAFKGVLKTLSALKAIVMVDNATFCITFLDPSYCCSFVINSQFAYSSVFRLLKEVFVRFPGRLSVCFVEG